MRNRYLDLLRAVATVRVVVYHSTGWVALTVVFPAMSVMFALAGSMMAASLDRYGPFAVERRLHRLLPSLWLIAAIAVPVMLATGMAWDWQVLLWAFPIEDPPAEGFWLQGLAAMWYLRDFLWFVLLSPLLLPLFRRFPLTTLSVPYVALAVITFAGLTPHVIVRDLALYGGAWLLGFAHHDGLLTPVRKSASRLLAAVHPASGSSQPRPAESGSVPSGSGAAGSAQSGSSSSGRAVSGSVSSGSGAAGSAQSGSSSSGRAVSGSVPSGSGATGFAQSGSRSSGPGASRLLRGVLRALRDSFEALRGDSKALDSEAATPARGAALARYRWWLVGVLGTAGAAWALTHPGPRGYDLNDIPLANALWSAAFILVVLGFSPQVAPRRTLTVLNARALTIYLWHVPLIIAVVRLAEATGLPVHGWVGISWRLAVVSVLLALVVLAVGWVEDISAGRRPTLVPGRTRRLAPVSPAPAGASDLSPQRAGTTQR